MTERLLTPKYARHSPLLVFAFLRPLSERVPPWFSLWFITAIKVMPYIVHLRVVVRAELVEALTKTRSHSYRLRTKTLALDETDQLKKSLEEINPNQLINQKT